MMGAFVLTLTTGATAQTSQPAVGEKPAEKAEILPGDYLDGIGGAVKARWRQHYREDPPVLSSERMRAAFMLGELMAESHLAVQAGDAQRFRNNNQEVQKLCGGLALSEKITPDVNAGSKMAESEDWPALRKQVQQTEQHIESVLNDQRDEDLAILMNLGLWMRLFDIGTSMVAEEADFDMQKKGVCIGSVSQINELAARYERLSETARSDEAIAMIGGLLEWLQRHWPAADDNTDPEVVLKTHDRINYTIGKVEGNEKAKKEK